MSNFNVRIVFKMLLDAWKIANDSALGFKSLMNPEQFLIIGIFLNKINFSLRFCQRERDSNLQKVLGTYKFNFFSFAIYLHVLNSMQFNHYFSLINNFSYFFHFFLLLFLASTIFFKYLTIRDFIIDIFYDFFYYVTLRIFSFSVFFMMMDWHIYLFSLYVNLKKMSL